MKKYLVIYYDRELKRTTYPILHTKKEITQMIKDDANPKYYHNFEIEKIYEVTGELKERDFVKTNRYIIYYDDEKPKVVNTTRKEIQKIFEEDYLGNIQKINTSYYKNGKYIERLLLKKEGIENENI